MPGDHTASPALGAKWAEVNTARRATAATADVKRPLSAKEEQCFIFCSHLFGHSFLCSPLRVASSTCAVHTHLSWEEALLGVCWAPVRGQDAARQEAVASSILP